MKKFFINTILFLFCTIIIYTIAIMFWGSYMPTEVNKNLKYRIGAAGYTNTRLNEVHQYNNVDVLFLGSSHAYRGFDPRIFKSYGYTSFNLGTSSQTPLQTEMLLKKHLEHLRPSVAVFEVYPYSFSSDGVESSVDLIANSDIDKNTFWLVTKLNSVKVYNTLLYAYIKRLFKKEKPIEEKKSIVGNREDFIEYTNYIQGGFMEKRVEKKVSINSDSNLYITQINEKAIMTDIGIIQSREGKWQPRENQLQAFERILEKLKEKKIRVILVQAPINSKYYAMIKCNKEIDDYFSSKGEYYNFNALMKLDNETDFADYDHLNQQGVHKMNLALIEKAFKIK